ncbi:hypothetical protein CR513_57193, partial [Mucuna pruriens]
MVDALATLSSMLQANQGREMTNTSDTKLRWYTTNSWKRQKLTKNPGTMSNQGSRPIEEGLSRDEVTLARLTPSRPSHATRPISSIKEWLGSTFHVSRPTQRPPQLQLSCHVTLGVACNASHARGRIGNPLFFDSVIHSNQFSTNISASRSNIFAEPGQMENNDRTLKELVTPDVVYQPWCIQYPLLESAQTRGPPQALEGIPCVSKTASIRKEICGIRQHTGETLHEYWKRFNKLCATCPHYQISEQLLIQYFYEGLSMMDRSMIDAASGGALMDKTPAAARHLISNMASNTQQFGIRGPNQPRMVNEIGAAFNQRLENQLTKLTSLVRQLAVSQHQPAMATKLCGICTSMEHPTDMCPTLQETEADQPDNVGAIGGFQYGKQPY